MSRARTDRRGRVGVTGALLLVVALAACGGEDAAAGDDAPGQPLRISAIPDQDPHELTAREEAMAEYLAEELDVDVEYVPVTDYAASVSLFRTGDLDVVFYGGLTGVQARLQTPGATVLAQRDIDERFQSVFIANRQSGIEPVDDVAGLTVLTGHSFTFGSESSTSGRLMPEYFLAEAGVDSAADFLSEPGYSGSHDKTIDLVQAGSYDAGALNIQVWEARKEAGTVDLEKVVEVFTTPEYHDYHWMAGPDTDERFGGGFTEELRTALTSLDADDPADAELLEMYGAGAVIPAEAEAYRQIEDVARRIGLIT